jgi:hypothetical protein
MLRQFNSNNRQPTRVIKQINLNSMSGSGYLDNMIRDYALQVSLSASFDGRDGAGIALPLESAVLEMSASIRYRYTSSLDIRIPTKFIANNRQPNRVIKQINLNSVSGSGYLDNILDDYTSQLSLSASFDGRDGAGIALPLESAVLEMSASIQYRYTSSLDIRIPTKLQSNTRSNPNPITITNNTNTINDFHTEILKFGARYVSRQIDAYDNDLNTLTIYSASLDYGTEGASAENFEILVNGLHVAGNYTIKEVGNNVVITLGGEYIEFDTVQTGDVYVFGKFLPIT